MDTGKRRWLSTSWGVLGGPVFQRGEPVHVPLDDLSCFVFLLWVTLKYPHFSCCLPSTAFCPCTKRLTRRWNVGVSLGCILSLVPVSHRISKGSSSDTFKHENHGHKMRSLASDHLKCNMTRDVASELLSFRRLFWLSFWRYFGRVKDEQQHIWRTQPSRVISFAVSLGGVQFYALIFLKCLFST